MAMAGAVNKERDSLLKEGEMLKLREEFWAAEDLWMDGLVEGALDRWLEERNKMPNKKRKVVRVAVPDAYIHFIMENPTLMRATIFPFPASGRGGCGQLIFRFGIDLRVTEGDPPLRTTVDIPVRTKQGCRCRRPRRQLILAS